MEHTADTQNRILNTARRLFHQQGYTAVGVADICRQAGVVKGSFYHFYSSKAELLNDVLRRNWKNTSDALDHLQTARGTGREKLARFVGMIVAHARHMNAEEGAIYGCNIGVIASEMGPSERTAESTITDIFSQWLTALTRLVESGQADGSIGREREADELAVALLASIQGMSVLGRTFNDPNMLQSAADNALNQLPNP